jgi:hypothetical protein
MELAHNQKVRLSRLKPLHTLFAQVLANPRVLNIQVATLQYIWNKEIRIWNDRIFWWRNDTCTVMIWDHNTPQTAVEGPYCLRKLSTILSYFSMKTFQPNHSYSVLSSYLFLMLGHSKCPLQLCICLVIMNAWKYFSLFLCNLKELLKNWKLFYQRYGWEAQPQRN